MPDFEVKPLTPRIHLVALIGVGVDADILPFWVRHYKALQFDSYTVFLHSCGEAGKDRAIEKMLLMDGFRVVMVPENALRDNPIMPNCPDMVRSILFDSFCLGLPQKDFLVTADGDEFQEWYEKPHELVSRGIKVLYGRLIDCFDETLHRVNPEMSLHDNYPMRDADLGLRFRLGPTLNQNKICMAPVSMPVDYSGSHDIKRGQSDSVFTHMVSSGPIDVLHYRWRDSAITRARGRRYWTDADLLRMRDFFSVEEKP